MAKYIVAITILLSLSSCVDPGQKSSANSKEDTSSGSTTTDTSSINTDDVAEGSTNLYFTSTRAQSATVVNSTSGIETTKAASVLAMKNYVSSAISSAATGDITAVVAGTGLTGGATSGSATLNVDVGNTANKIIQLDSLGRIPPVDGSLLLNIPISTKVDKTTTINGLALNANVSLDTDDISEGVLNLYHTSARARSAAVVNSTSGSETDQAPSVAAMKSFVTSYAVPGVGDFKADGSIPMSGDLDIGNNNVKYKSTNTNYVQLKAPDALASTISLILPSSVGVNGQFLTTDGLGNLSWGSSAGDITAVVAGVGLTGGATTGSATLNVNVGTAPNQIVQLDGAGRLPAVDGSQLTNLPNTSTAAVLSGFITGANTSINNADTVETAFEKAQGQLNNKVDKTISVNGQTLNANVSLDSDDIAEGVLNLYYTTTRARTAAVVNSTAGSETDQAPSVAAMKSYVASYAVPGVGDFKADGTVSMTGDLDVGNNNVKYKSTNTNYVQLKAPNALAATYSLIFPADDGTSGQFLSTDGSGNLAWATPAGSGDFKADGTVSMTGDLDVGNNNVKYKSTNTNYVQLKAPNALAATYSLIFPADDGTSGQILTTDGSGNLSWANVGGTGDFKADGTVSMTGNLDFGNNFASFKSTNTNYVQLKAPNALAATYSLIFPADDGTSGQFLSTDGSGNLSWSTPAGSGDITDVVAGTGLTGGASSGSATLNVDVGTTANKIVQLDATGKLPAIDGSQLTNLPSAGTSAVLTGFVAGADTAILATDTVLEAFQKTQGQLNTRVVNSRTVNGQSLNADVTLDTDDVSEGVLNLYHTTTRARTAAVVNSTAGSETDQAPSVAAIKSYISSYAVAGAGDFKADGSVPMTGDLDVGNNNVKYKSTNTNYVQLKAPNSLAATYSLIFPADDGTSGQFLSTDGSGNLAWATPAGSGDFKADGSVPMTGNLDFGNNFASFKSTNTNYVQLKAPNALAATYSLIFPADDGTSGQILTTDGSGNLSWASVSGTGDFKADGTVSMTGDLDVGNNNVKYKSTNTNYVQLKAPNALAATYSLIFPADDGTSGQILTTDGSGNLSWASVSGTGDFKADGTVSMTGDLDVGNNNVKYKSTNTNYVQLKAPNALAATYSLIFPADDGTSGQFLSTDGSGNLSWSTPAGSGDITDVVAGTGLTGGASSGSATLNVDVGTTANKIVQLDASGKLPAIDGSQLINLPSGGGGGTSSVLTGYVVGANSAILATDTVLEAFQKTQGQLNAKVDKTITVNGESLNANVILDSDDISEGVLNLYHTTARARAAAVVNVTTGTEADQAASVAAMKTYVAAQLASAASAWSSSGSDIYFNSGNVGIGVSSPTATLEVGGQIKITGGTPAAGKVLTSDAAGLATWEDPPSGGGSGAGGDNMGDQIATDNIILGNYYISGDGGDEGVAVGADGKVGIGTNTPLEALHVAATPTNDAGILLDSDNAAITIFDTTAGGGIQLDVYLDNTGNFEMYDTTHDESRFMLDNSTGNIGIGALDVPQSRFEVTSDERQLRLLDSDDLTGIWTIGTDAAVDDTTLFFIDEDVNNRMALTKEGNLGIGGSDLPQSRLEVTSDERQIRILDSDDATSVWTIGTDSLIDDTTLFFIDEDVNNRMALTKDGKLGIGVDAPTYNLEVDGDVYASGCVEVDGDGVLGGTCLSDKRFKTNIHSLKNSLEKITSLRPVKFDWKPSAFEAHHKKGSEIGLIAQEVEEVFPEFVASTEDGYKKVKYNTSLTMHIIQAIKDFFNQFSADKVEKDRKIASLENKIEELERNNEEMREAMCELKPELKICRKVTKEEKK